MLYDLQKVCIEQERNVYRLDLVEWVRTFGKRPIRRPLPLLRDALMIRHLRTALGRLATAQLARDEREHVAALLKAAQDEAWSSARLEEESARVRATLEHRSGRPPVPPMLRAVRKLTATWHKLESAADSVELEALSTTQVQAASRAIAELRERMDRLARRLVSDDTPDAASSAASLDRTH